MNKAIGEKIRLLRLSKNLSQENIANELDLSVGAYSNIERGKTDISVTRIYRIAKILKTTPGQLLDIISVSIKQDEVNEPQSEYKTVKKQLNALSEKVNEFHSIIENQIKEINYLKEIIELLKKKKK